MLQISLSLLRTENPSIEKFAAKLEKLWPTEEDPEVENEIRDELMDLSSALTNGGFDSEDQMHDLINKVVERHSLSQFRSNFAKFLVPAINSLSMPTSFLEKVIYLTSHCSHCSLTNVDPLQILR